MALIRNGLLFHYLLQAVLKVTPMLVFCLCLCHNTAEVIKGVVYKYNYFLFVFRRWW